VCAARRTDRYREYFGGVEVEGIVVDVAEDAWIVSSDMVFAHALLAELELRDVRRP
jgi:hypothetical protein